MKKTIRKKIEKSAEGLLLISSLVTSITILLIVFFLFKEGVGIFNQSSVESGHVLLVNKENTVESVTTADIKQIFDQEITNWKTLGGANDSIILVSIDEIAYNYTEEELGAEFENLPNCINDYISKNTGAIGYFSENYVPENFKGKILPFPNIGLFDFLLGKEWFPTAQPAAQYGVLPLILGTLMVSIGAILLALPIGLITAVYMSEVADIRIRNIMKPLIELLAGIPSVVYGFFGLVVIVPFIQNLFKLDLGETALAGSIVLAIMALPTIITISEDALRSTPTSLKEASLALGASKLQTLLRVILPHSISGITTASILGVGRAVGETMAVLMVTGNASVMPKTFLEPVRTIPATIAAELGEAPFGGTHFKALFALGIILFLITFTFNMIVEVVKTRREKSLK